MEVSFCSKIPKVVCVWCVCLCVCARACMYIHIILVKTLNEAVSTGTKKTDQLIVHGAEVRLGQRQTRSVKNGEELDTDTV